MNGWQSWSSSSCPSAQARTSCVRSWALVQYSQYQINKTNNKKLPANTKHFPPNAKYTLSSPNTQRHIQLQNSHSQITNSQPQMPSTCTQIRVWWILRIFKYFLIAQTAYQFPHSKSCKQFMALFLLLPISTFLWIFCWGQW